jgi:hypothetical protein
MMSDTITRVKAMAILMPRVVDLNNWGKLVMTCLTDEVREDPKPHLNLT